MVLLGWNLLKKGYLLVFNGLIKMVFWFFVNIIFFLFKEKLFIFLGVLLKLIKVSFIFCFVGIIIFWGKNKCFLIFIIILGKVNVRGV